MKLNNTGYTLYKMLMTFICAAALLTGCGGEGESSAVDGSGPKTISRSDMNGDGRADLILEYGESASTSPLITYRVSGADQFEFDGRGGLFKDYNTAVYKRVRAIAVSDSNNDGRGDLLVQIDTVSGMVELQVLLPNVLGRYNVVSAKQYFDGNDFRAVAFNDIDGDGVTEVLVSEQSNGVVEYSMLLINTAGGFDKLGVISFDLSEGRPEVIALEDINNDGKADIVLDTQLGDRHCYTVMLFNQGGFFEQPDFPNCINDSVPNLQNVLGTFVADLDGNGISELIISYEYQFAPNDIRTGLFNFTFNNGTKGNGQSVSYWAGSINVDYQLGSGDNRIIAVADLNNDSRADVLYEKTLGVSREWWVFLSRDDGLNPGRDLWMSGLATDNTLGLRDYNGDGFLDLLIDTTDTTTLQPTQKLQVSFNLKGEQFDSISSTIWHEDSATPRVVGLEEDGLTSIANDRTELIAWAGVANSYYTHNEFKQLLASKGLALTPAAEMTPGKPLAQDQCTINYSQADATRSKYNVGAEAEFGLLVCNIKLGDRASIRIQAIYGGCNATDGLSGVSAKCEVGTFNAELAVDLSPAPTTTLGVKGPNAVACGGVSTRNVCAEIGADLVETSAKVETIGIGAGGSLAIGVGAGGDFSIDDGVISGRIELKFLVGGSIEFSLDPAEAGTAFYKLGETSYLFAEDAGEFVVYAAGPAVYDAANFVSDGTVEVANITAGGAVYLATEAGETAVVVFEDTGEAIGTVFTDLANAVGDIFSGIGDSISCGFIFC